MEYFNEYLNSKFYEPRAEQINAYAAQETGTSISAATMEMKKFIKIRIAMCSFKYPRYHTY